MCGLQMYDVLLCAGYNRFIHTAAYLSTRVSANGCVSGCACRHVCIWIVNVSGSHGVDGRVERLAREHVLGRIQQRVGCSKKGTEGLVKGLAYDNDRIDIKHTLSHLVWVTHTHTHTMKYSLIHLRCILQGASLNVKNF